MAISIPGLSLSILRQQTTVQAGLPLLISGRFTAFGLGVPTFIRVFLEGPSYDPQLRSFDTFASPFSGDYSTNVIAEKDGQYNVYAQAFPPPLIPTGPPFPEAMMLLPPFAESTRPPLVVGFPFDGGVDALLPDGTRQRLEAPPLQPIEFRPIITVAPGITITAPGVPAAYPGIPTYPPAVPPAPPAVPPVEAIVRATIDDIRFSPDEVDPGVEATGVLSWRNTGDEPHLFDTFFYLVSPVGARYGPLQVNHNVRANPQVPNTQNMRLSTAGLPPGVYSVVAEIYDSTTFALLAAQTLPGRLSIREIAPVVPVPPVPIPVPPPPVEVPTIDILGMPSLNLPRQLNIGDVWSGSVSLPTFGTISYFVEAQLWLRDPQGYEHIVSRPGGRTLQPGDTLQIPVNFDTTGWPGGNYTILLRVFDQFGQQVTEFPMGFLSLIEAVVPPVPEVVPELPTAEMIDWPSMTHPSQVTAGDIWSGTVSIPTLAPVPYYFNAQLLLEGSQVGQVVPQLVQPGQTLQMPVSLNTAGYTPGDYAILVRVFDQMGNQLIEFPMGFLTILEAVVPAPPEIYRGRILDLEVVYDTTRVPLGTTLPLGATAVVSVPGRNDMDTAQQIAMSWTLKDPDGQTAEKITRVWSPSISPGSYHIFEGGRISLNKPGRWPIMIYLWMNPDNPVIAVPAKLSFLWVAKAPAPPTEYTLEVTIEPPGSGYVTKSPSKAAYSAGEVLTLVATPYLGYEFDHWGGWPPYPAVGSTSPTLKITMDADWWVIAAFRKEGAPLPPLPPPMECTPGDLKCEYRDLYECSAEGQWVLLESNSSRCRVY